MIRAARECPHPDTPFPYTTLFRSHRINHAIQIPTSFRRACPAHQPCSSRSAEPAARRPKRHTTNPGCHHRIGHPTGAGRRHYGDSGGNTGRRLRSEEHTSELQSLMRISYAVFCLKKNNDNIHTYLLTADARTILTTYEIEVNTSSIDL